MLALLTATQNHSLEIPPIEFCKIKQILMKASTRVSHTPYYRGAHNC